MYVCNHYPKKKSSWHLSIQFCGDFAKKGLGMLLMGHTVWGKVFTEEGCVCFAMGGWVYYVGILHKREKNWGDYSTGDG